MMVSQQEIYGKIVEVLSGEFDVEKENLNPDSKLFEDLKLDSLDAVDFIVALEKIFGFRAQEEEVKKLRTVQDIVHFIEEQQKK